MGPMEVHSHNDHRLNKYKLKNKPCCARRSNKPVFRVEKVKNTTVNLGDILVNSIAIVAPTESNKNPSTG